MNKDIDKLLERGILLKENYARDFESHYGKGSPYFDFLSAFEHNVDDWICDVKNILRKHDLSLYVKFIASINDLSSDTSKKYFQKLEVYLDRLASFNLNTTDFDESEVVYTLSLDPLNNYLYINDHKFKRINLGSATGLLVSYLYKNSNKLIHIEDIKRYYKSDTSFVNKLSKDGVLKLIMDAGFNSELNKYFFNSLSHKTVYFAPNVSKAYLEKHSLPPISLKDL